MTEFERKEKTLLELIELLDIPDSYYERAKARYQSLAEWFCHAVSSRRTFDPIVYPHGSFRLGTVVPAVFACDKYDLDVVCALVTTKPVVNQATIMNLTGD